MHTNDNLISKLHTKYYHYVLQDHKCVHKNHFCDMWHNKSDCVMILTHTIDLIHQLLFTKSELSVNITGVSKNWRGRHFTKVSNKLWPSISRIRNAVLEVRDIPRGVYQQTPTILMTRSAGSMFMIEYDRNICLWLNNWAYIRYFCDV